MLISMGCCGRHGGSWVPTGKVWQVPSATLPAALKDLAGAPGLRVEVEDMHPITDKIMQASLPWHTPATVLSMPHAHAPEFIKSFDQVSVARLPPQPRPASGF